MILASNLLFFSFFGVWFLGLWGLGKSLKLTSMASGDFRREIRVLGCLQWCIFSHSEGGVDFGLEDFLGVLETKMSLIQ